MQGEGSIIISVQESIPRPIPREDIGQRAMTAGPHGPTTADHVQEWIPRPFRRKRGGWARRELLHNQRRSSRGRMSAPAINLDDNGGRRHNPPPWFQRQGQGKTRLARGRKGFRRIWGEPASLPWVRHQLRRFPPLPPRTSVRSSMNLITLLIRNGNGRMWNKP